MSKEFTIHMHPDTYKELVFSGSSEQMYIFTVFHGKGQPASSHLTFFGAAKEILHLAGENVQLTKDGNTWAGYDSGGTRYAVIRTPLLLSEESAERENERRIDN